MATFNLPTTLRPLAGGADQLEAAGATVGEALRQLERAHPRLAGWVLDESGGLRRHVSLFVNDTLAAPDSPLAPGDQVYIVPAISGGAPGSPDEVEVLAGTPAKLAVGISSAGVWVTEDAGASWRRGTAGLVPRYIPAEARPTTTVFCIHKLLRAEREPATLYLQFHGGVYRSDDAGLTWSDIGTGTGLPSDFGFPMVLDPRDPARAFVIPLVADADRVTPEGRLRVYETLDRGASWRALTAGLPQENCYLTVLRQAFGHDGGDPLGLYFGAESGDLYASPDGGRTWSAAIVGLPPILSVRAHRLF